MVRNGYLEIRRFTFYVAFVFYEMNFAKTHEQVTHPTFQQYLNKVIWLDLLNITIIIAIYCNLLHLIFNSSIDVIIVTPYYITLFAWLFSI